MQDLTGQFTYSPVVQVSIAGLPAICVAYPSPALSAHIEIWFFSNTDHIYQVTLEIKTYTRSGPIRAGQSGQEFADGIATAPRK
jgi:hypothetical protein